MTAVTQEQIQEMLFYIYEITDPAEMGDTLDFFFRMLGAVNKEADYGGYNDQPARPYGEIHTGSPNEPLSSLLG